MGQRRGIGGRGWGRGEEMEDVVGVEEMEQRTWRGWRTGNGGRERGAGEEKKHVVGVEETEKKI